MAPEVARSDGEGSSDAAARSELDRALARVAFRALGSRDAEKLRDMASSLTAADVRKSVHTAADIFVHAVLCAVNGSEPDPALAAAAAQAPAMRVSETAAAVDSSGPAAFLSRRRKSMSRRRSEPIRREPVVRPGGDDLQSCCQELSRLSSAVAELTSSHRTAVTSVCNDVLRTACPLLCGIQAQYGKGIAQAVEATRKAATRVDKLLLERARARARRSTAVGTGDNGVVALTDRVAIAAAEALFQSSCAVEMLKTRLSCGGFKAVVASSRLDTRHLFPRRRDAGPSARVASLLNIIDGRAAELASITSKFSNDVDMVLSLAQGFKSARNLS